MTTTTTTKAKRLVLSNTMVSIPIREADRAAARDASYERARATLDLCAERLGYLYGRWQDESEYEDWSEYVAAMRAMLPLGFTFRRAAKRPFGFSFDDNEYRAARYEMRVSGNAVTLRRVDFE